MSCPAGPRNVTLLAPARTTEYVFVGSRSRSPALVAPVNEGADADCSSTRTVGAGETVASDVPE
jgi:bifunctional N-acetylglucosamine-1-phosphate-uridyltransferase/glucosamine-1-phosphate-acetyltransferase GlmU-like protein